MGNIKFNHIYKYYKGEQEAAVHDFHLEVFDGEFLVFVGPSGCGKSTTLRMLAGLEEISKGELFINGKFTNYTPSRDRDIAMVFQNYALYPNLSVYQNMSLGLQLRKIAKHEINLRVVRAAKMLEISHLLDKYPGQLSGGQKQRVALGRALVREPQVFLMDEPLSNLDAKLRTQTRAEIIKIYQQLQTTFIYVTHDQTEAMTMGTRIVVMRDGKIQQVDTPQKLYDEPCNLFVAGFIGTPQMSLIEGAVVRHEDGYYFENNRVKLLLPDRHVRSLQRMGHNVREVVLGLRPEHVLCEPDLLQKKYCENWMVRTTVKMKELLGADMYVYTELGSDILVTRADRNLPLQIGDKLEVALRMDKAHIFDRASGRAIASREEIG